MKNLNKFSRSLSVMVLILTIVLIMPLAIADNHSNTSEGNETNPDPNPEGVELVPNVFNVDMEERNILILLGFLLLISLGLYIIDFKAFSSLIIVITGFIILTNLNAFIIGLIVLLVGIILIFKT